MTTEDIEKYKNMVDSTGDNLRELCDQWSREIAQNEKTMNEEVVQKVQSVIGKSQLLRNSKFKQFKGFLRDAEEKTIGKPVMLDDIRGFWETILLQVDEVITTFEELDQLKANNYVIANTFTVPDGVCLKKAVKKVVMTTTTTTTTAPAPAAAAAAACSKKPVVSASSSLKNFISAQRERKKLNDVGSNVHIIEKIPSNGHA